jgi:hypothetical protein
MPHPDMEWMNLFGLRYTDEAVTDFLSKQPPHKADKPSDGSQYVVCEQGGFDLLFDTRHAQASSTSNRQDRRLSGIFFYNEGVDKHQRYPGPLPLGFDFADGRPVLLHKHTPERTWVIGEGRVPVDHPEPDHDRWDFAPLQVSAHYGDDGVEILYFVVSQPSGKPEWKPAETWQSLALLPDRKADAIKLYREKHNVGVADAKRAVEQHAAQAARLGLSPGSGKHL